VDIEGKLGEKEAWVLREGDRRSMYIEVVRRTGRRGVKNEDAEGRCKTTRGGLQNEEEEKGRRKTKEKRGGGGGTMKTNTSSFRVTLEHQQLQGDLERGKDIKEGGKGRC
jgi:hypothetical protein